jgi:nucleotidyltransferase/DNA polymerase involved in DNA repair
MSQNDSRRIESRSSIEDSSRVEDALDQLLRLLARDVVRRLRREQGLMPGVGVNPPPPSPANIDHYTPRKKL